MEKKILKGDLLGGLQHQFNSRRKWRMNCECNAAILMRRQFIYIFKFENNT